MRRAFPWAALALLTAPTWAWAAEADTTIDPLSTLWVLVAAFLVFFMQAGFAALTAGLIRAKNAANMLMKNLLDFCMASLGYFMFGFALMYGSAGALFGTEGWFLIDAESPVEGLPLHAFWLFQATFCGATATIVAGGMAERMKFSIYLVYSFLISAFVYPIVGHWTWGGGWLYDLGFHDFAGSTVVHAVGGITALVGIYQLGPRFGKFQEDGSPTLIPGHNPGLVALGVFILWLGWFGFNPGSTLGFSDPALVAKIAVNTNLAASAAAMTSMFVAWAKFGKPDMSLTFNGALAGLVAITAGCDAVTPGAAIYIGIAAGVLSVFGVIALDALGLDDPVGAVTVHGLNGIWGTLAVGLFHLESGLFYGGGGAQLGIQAVGIFASLGFVAVVMAIVFKLLDSIWGLRVDLDTELRGLDIEEHGMESYSGFQIFITES